MPSPALRPHFFELYAAERLTSTLRPALRYALEVLSVRHPFVLPYANRSDTIFTALSLLLDATHLSVHSSTLSESFYGLRRARTFSSSTQPPLARAAVVSTLLFSALLPHAKLALDRAYTTSSASAASHPRLTGWQQRVASAAYPDSAFVSVRRVRSLADLAAVIRALAARWNLHDAFLKWYPALSAAYEGTGLLFNIAYLLGGARYFSPSLLLQGLVVRRQTVREMSDEARPVSSKAAPLAVGAGLVLSGAKQAFVAAVFAFRFLEYYIAAEQRAPPQTSTAIVPPPPQALPPAPGVDASASASKVLCPLCGQARVNAAACTASGYVFCYSCISSHVQEHRSCPVTLMRATTDDILRVYESES